MLNNMFVTDKEVGSNDIDIDSNMSYINKDTRYIYSADLDDIKLQ